jgi:hypothetical protein
VEVVYRPDDEHRWDYPAIIEAYHKLGAPPPIVDK